MVLQERSLMGQDRLILDQITIAMLHVITSMDQGQEVTHIIRTEANIEVIHDQGHDQGQGDIIKGNIHILDLEVVVIINAQGQDLGLHITTKNHPDTQEAEADHQTTEIVKIHTVKDMVMVEVTVDHHLPGTEEEEEEGNTRTHHPCQTEEDMLEIGINQNQQSVLAYLDSVYTHRRGILGMFTPGMDH